MPISQVYQRYLSMHFWNIKIWTIFYLISNQFDRKLQYQRIDFEILRYWQYLIAIIIVGDLMPLSQVNQRYKSMPFWNLKIWTISYFNFSLIQNYIYVFINNTKPTNWFWNLNILTVSHFNYNCRGSYAHIWSKSKILKPAILK